MARAHVVGPPVPSPHACLGRERGTLSRPGRAVSVPAAPRQVRGTAWVHPAPFQPPPSRAPRAHSLTARPGARSLYAPRGSPAPATATPGGAHAAAPAGSGLGGVSPLLGVTQKAPQDRASRCALEPQTERASAGLGTEPARGGPGAGRGGPRRGDGSRAHTPQP